ncbi:hypothetical protein [Nostoc sp. TCL26-01]|uniref:hypothetical protein n=1 Tax=Nostoc sp. TCL26-01 TaxID=2576904 RepID=UPI0015BBB4B0|nr:hypothetical protein [Nostoc sp. TCL26-01]QLE59680.1 hypothetical protein FD725_30015 [Nostoc sp. TCL26-01]
MAEINLIDLVSVTQYLLSQIAQHPDLLKLEYYSDLTIGDAKTALSYLKDEREHPLLEDIQVLGEYNNR